MKASKLAIVIIFISVFFIIPLSAGDIQNWHIIISPSLQQDEAIKVAITDLKETGKKLGLFFLVVNDENSVYQNSIIVGNAENNRLTTNLVHSNLLKLNDTQNDQGYEIITKQLEEKRVLIVAGDSVIGNVYGLYWIWDRLRVYKKIPDINVRKIPALEIRMQPQAKGSSNNKEYLHQALRYNANWVTYGNPLNLIPWEAEPEASENKKNRQTTREFIKYAHNLHFKYFVYGDEFSYHPSLIEKNKTKLTPCDESMWNALQEKYRMLFRAMPEIDGVGIRTGESTQVWGNYSVFNVMHEAESCEWSLDKRYRTFVKKMHDVVVKEFNKLYYQRTWVTSIHEQHTQPEVFKKIFTDEIPQENIYIVPKLTATDCWYHQPYNRTFNQTAHNTILEFENMIQFSNNNFTNFAGKYYQSGIQTILSDQSTNMKGFGFDIPTQDKWQTPNANAYVLYRLTWNPYEDMRQIARDFSAIHFGLDAADIMSDIFLMSASAYKYGIYIEPMAYGKFNSLSHLRGTTIPAKGFPLIDHGKRHIAELQKIYLRCKPWKEETLMYLDHGLALMDSMKIKFNLAKTLIDDEQLAQDTENSLDLLNFFIRTNNLYVKTFFSYFDYREYPTMGNKKKLHLLSDNLSNSMREFRQVPGFNFKLFGPETLLQNVDFVLADLEKAEKMLSDAPNDEEIKKLILKQQNKFKEVLEQHKNNAVKLLHWEGRIDGRDVVNISGSELSIKHLRFSPIANMSYQFFTNLPQKPVTVIPVDIESRSYRPFVLEQPCKENNYTAKIYLSDTPLSGYSWWKFDLYYILKSPEELGLVVPWKSLDAMR